MSAEGIFHDAHEVNIKRVDGSTTWVATFMNKGLADWYVKIASQAMASAGTPIEYEVVPV